MAACPMVLERSTTLHTSERYDNDDDNRDDVDVDGAAAVQCVINSESETLAGADAQFERDSVWLTGWRWTLVWLAGWLVACTHARTYTHARQHACT